MPELNEQPIIELGKNPIPGPAAWGADAAEDEQYILIQGEVGKLDRIETGEPDWYGLEQAATNILRSKAKDIEVAAYLGFALFKRYGYAGLAASLAMLTEMVNTFWDGAFPERPRRRKARIETLTDRFADGGWFRDRAPKPDEFDAVDLCVTRIDELNNALKAKMPDDPADFGKFVRGVKELAGRRPKPATAGAAPAGAEGGAPAAAPAAGGASLPAAEISDVSGAINQLLSAATFIRKAEPTHPVPYAVVRAIKWSRIVLPTTPAAKFEIEPPEATKLDALTHQMSNGSGEPAQKRRGRVSVERPVVAGPAALCVRGDGGAGVRLREGASDGDRNDGELGQPVGEGLFELRFKNGTPLCSGETKMWIESEAAP
jgi:type VI secretion system protein VasJ